VWDGSAHVAGRDPVGDAAVRGEVGAEGCRPHGSEGREEVPAGSPDRCHNAGRHHLPAPPLCGVPLPGSSCLARRSWRLPSGWPTSAPPQRVAHLRPSPAGGPPPPLPSGGPPDDPPDVSPIPLPLQESLADAMKYNDQIKQHLNRIADDLHPLRVRALFENIPDEDLDLLDIQGESRG
jgi:hypothetical protein